jgi:hypothetical protein
VLALFEREEEEDDDRPETPTTNQVQKASDAEPISAQSTTLPSATRGQDHRLRRTAAARR